MGVLSIDKSQTLLLYYKFSFKSNIDTFKNETIDSETKISNESWPKYLQQGAAIMTQINGPIK